MDSVNRSEGGYRGSRRRLNSALVSAGLARKSGQVAYGRFVVLAMMTFLHQLEEDVGLLGLYVDVP
jgi:hypothetical protein